MFVSDELPEVAKSIAKRLEQMIGRGVIGFQFVQNLLGSLIGIEQFCGAAKLVLVASQVRHANIDQTVKRYVDHLVIQEFPPVILRSDFEVAIRFGQQLILDPFLVRLKS